MWRIPAYGIAAIAPYLLWAFIYMSFNPILWGMDARVVMAMVTAAALAFAAVVFEAP